MDLTLDVENYKLNIRAGCIINHNNKILFHRNINSDHYCIIGGRIEIGESSEDTIKREMMEELKKEIEITGYVGTIENFFEMGGKKYHEIMFIYKAEFEKDEDKIIEENLKNCEGNDFLKYEWLEIDKIDDYPIKPKSIKSIIKQGIFPVHIINDDRKRG